MKIEDVIALAKAGFTADQIARMNGEDPTLDAQEPAPVASNTSIGSSGSVEPAPAPEPERASAPAPAPSDDGALLKEIKELRQAIQAGAIRNTNSAGPQEQTIEEVLASIIEP